MAAPRRAMCKPPTKQPLIVDVDRLLAAYGQKMLPLGPSNPLLAYVLPTANWLIGRKCKVSRHAAVACSRSISDSSPRAAAKRTGPDNGRPRMRDPARETSDGAPLTMQCDGAGPRVGSEPVVAGF